MTIEKGKSWGREIIVPEERVVVLSDFELSLQPQNSLCFLQAGDLWTTLGQPAAKNSGDAAISVPIDALQVSLRTDSEESIVIAASSIEVGEWCSLLPTRMRSRYIAVTNGGRLRTFDIAPRAHPNDGFIDVLHIKGSISFRQRILSYRRAMVGNHLPHPHISCTRHQTFDIHNESRHELLRIDGRSIARWSSISIRVLPDYWNVII